MTAVTFDTLELVKKLQEWGFTAHQAEGVSEALKDVMAVSELATRGDVAALKTDIEKLELKIEAEVRVLKWMIGVATAGIVSIVLKSFF